jgi:hypothetical protein
MKSGEIKVRNQKEETFKITLEFKTMKGFGGGFRQDWVSGENEELKAGMDSGGGLGNPLLTFWIEKKGENRKYFTTNISKALEQAIEAVT